MKKQMQKYIDNDSYISIERDFIDDMDLGMYCFPCKLCGNVVVVRFTGDFEYNGFRVVSFDDISGMQYGETEKFYEKIHKENAVPDAEMPDFDGADGFGGILKVLKDDGITVVVECELEEDGYYMGRVVSVDEDTVTMKCFDGCAKWLNDEQCIDLDSITMLTFLDRYSTILSQYAK